MLMIVSHDNQKQIIADNFDGFKQMSVSEAYHLSLMTKKMTHDKYENHDKEQLIFIKTRSSLVNKMYLVQLCNIILIQQGNSSQVMKQQVKHHVAW